MEYIKLLILALGLIGYFVLHSILADFRVKSLLTRTIISKRYYRLIYNFLAIILLLPLVWLGLKILPTLLFENQWLSFAGFGLLIFGFVLLLLSLRQYNLSEFSGLQQMSNKKTLSSSALRTSGLNAIVRHPLYTSSLIMLWAWFLTNPLDVVLIV